MPTTHERRASFAARFNPQDLSALTKYDAEDLRTWLLSGKIWEYPALDAGLALVARAAWMLRRFERVKRASWKDRAETCGLITPDDPFWIVARASAVTEKALEEARLAHRVLIDAHRQLGWRSGRAYGLLRRDRKRAWHAFCRIALPAVREGIDAYVTIIVSRI